MRTGTLIFTLLVVASVVVAETPPPVPHTPAAVDDIVYAKPFTLEHGYKFEWRKEQPMVTKGMILVLKVKPDLVFPRQSPEPVLYVGDQTAERVNVGHKSGHVVAVVPGEVDLHQATIWFGTPGLPEQVDANTIEAEQKAATNAGIKPFDKKIVLAARKSGGKELEVADRYELGRHLGRVIRKYAPDESALADTLLTPRIERKKAEPQD